MRNTVQIEVDSAIVARQDWRRAAQIGDIQSIGGEYYIWEMPRKMNNIEINNRMSDIGGAGITVRDTKIWTNSSRTKERIEEELKS